MLRVAFLVFAIVAACDPPQRCALTPKTYYFQNEVASRSVSASLTTPKGIAVDPSSYRNLSLSRIDRLVDEPEACLRARFPGGVLPHSVALASGCRAETFVPTVPRGCITVKVIDDWFLSSVEFAGSKHQMIPEWVVADGCTEKGMASGPCYRRVGIINYTTIVVPPSLYVFKEGVVKITTGCSFPWASPELAACMTPTTGPLDDGSGP